MRILDSQILIVFWFCLIKMFNFQKRLFFFFGGGTFWLPPVASVTYIWKNYVFILLSDSARLSDSILKGRNIWLDVISHQNFHKLLDNYIIWGTLHHLYQWHLYQSQHSLKSPRTKKFENIKFWLTIWVFRIMVMLLDILRTPSISVPSPSVPTQS